MQKPLLPALHIKHYLRVPRLVRQTIYLRFDTAKVPQETTTVSYKKLKLIGVNQVQNYFNRELFPVACKVNYRFGLCFTNSRTLQFPK